MMDCGGGARETFAGAVFVGRAMAAAKDVEYLHEAGQERRCGLQAMRLLLQMRQEPTRAVVLC